MSEAKFRLATLGLDFGALRGGGKRGARARRCCRIMVVEANDATCGCGCRLRDGQERLDLPTFLTLFLYFAAYNTLLLLMLERYSTILTE